MERCLLATTRLTCLCQGAPCNVAIVNRCRSPSRRPAWCLGCAGCARCAHRDRELSFVQVSQGLRKPYLGCSVGVQWTSSGRTSRQRTPRASGPRASNACLPRPESTPMLLQHVAAKVQSCQAFFSRQSRCTDGLEAPRLEIFLHGATKSSATCPVSSAERRTLRVCRGVSVTAVSISARPSLVRRRFTQQRSNQRQQQQERQHKTQKTEGEKKI